MKPMKKVTDPQSIRDKEIPSINDANPAGVIGGTAAALLRAGAASSEDDDGI